MERPGTTVCTQWTHCHAEKSDVRYFKTTDFVSTFWPARYKPLEH